MATIAIVDKKEAKPVDWMSILKNLGVMVLGTIVGNISGAAAASMSVAAPMVGGIGFSGLGFYLIEKIDDKKWIGYFTLGVGAGMLTSPVVQVSASTVKGLNGLAALGADSKEGVGIAINNLATKFYLHKTPLAKYLPEAGAGTVNGLGNLALTDEEAKKVIDEMIKEQESKKTVEGLGDQQEGTISIFKDHGFNGSLKEDFGNVELGDLDQDFGDLGDPVKRKNAESIFHRARKKFGANHPNLVAFAKKHPKLFHVKKDTPAAIPATTMGSAELDGMFGLGKSKSLMEDYAA